MKFHQENGKCDRTFRLPKTPVYLLASVSMSVNRTISCIVTRGPHSHTLHDRSPPFQSREPGCSIQWTGSGTPSPDRLSPSLLHSHSPCPSPAFPQSLLWSKWTAEGPVSPQSPVWSPPPHKYPECCPTSWMRAEASAGSSVWPPFHRLQTLLTPQLAAWHVSTVRCNGSCWIFCESGWTMSCLSSSSFSHSTSRAPNWGGGTGEAGWRERLGWPNGTRHLSAKTKQSVLRDSEERHRSDYLRGPEGCWSWCVDHLEGPPTASMCRPRGFRWAPDALAKA